LFCTDTGVICLTNMCSSRTLDVKWNTFTPGGSTLAKRSIITAVAGEDDGVYMLVCSTSAKSWKSSEPTLRAVASSWKVASTGKVAKKGAKVDGMGQSMFKKQNEERAALQKEREEEGIY
jgi:hypothetical protein